MVWPKRTLQLVFEEQSSVCNTAGCAQFSLLRCFTENNLFLVKRLVQRTDQRNPDPSHQRYTSLAWAAVQGNEETFEFLLQNGHDDYECSRVRLMLSLWQSI